MVIVKLLGGLGNQMFQYAAGRRLAHVLGTELKLDISGYQNQGPLTQRRYNLEVFNIQQKIASADEIRSLKGPESILPPAIIVERLTKLRLIPSYIHRIRQTRFDPAILSLPDNVYLNGIWQSEKYFIDIAEIIRKEFTLKNPPPAKNKELSDLITATESISIHVRRTDYVHNRKTQAMHGHCDIDYYRACVDQLIKKVKKPHFFIFSDDPQWTSENLKLEYPTTLVTHNQEDQCHEDLTLMSQCKHHIIANSSFSWWGAWLNPGPGKTIFAPRRWFKNLSYDSNDIIPEKWIRI